VPSLQHVIVAVYSFALTLAVQPAQADTCAEICTGLEIQIARAMHRRSGFEVRGQLANRTLTRRLNRDIAIIGRRITATKRLVARASGTTYEARAERRLEDLLLRRQAILVTARRRANRLSTGLQSALHRIDARIAAFRQDAATHGCPVEPSA
jgi:hypothetical protein